MRDRNSPLSAGDIAGLDWDKGGGLIPAVVQDARSGQLLMLGYMTKGSLAATFECGLATFWSRSRNALWRKGETSGNVLAVREIRADCDDDTLLILAEPAGPTCHTGATSCFGGEAPGSGWLASLERIITERGGSDPAQSYTARLLGEGVKRIAQKVGEEGVEVALAATGGSDAELLGEGADLVYHLTVLLAARGLDWQALIDELRQRHRSAG